MKDYGLLQEVVERMDDNDGFVEVGNDKKAKTRLLMKKETGNRLLTLKLEAIQTKISIFNIIALVNEVELMSEWFPFCKKGVTVNNSKLLHSYS